MKSIYIASCVENGGIYRYLQDGSGRLVFADKTDLKSPMYMTVEGRTLYAVLRDPYSDSKESGVVSFEILPNGSLDSMKELGSTLGRVACHIAVENGEVYCANYISGSVVKLPSTLVTHQGSGPHPARQDAPHTHFVGLTPDKKYLCAVDLGLDTVFVYNKDLTLNSIASVPAGHGARHIVFSDNGRYMFCANELESTMSVFAYSDGELTLIDTQKAIPEGFDSTAAAIRIYKGKIYLSNRGHDSVSEFTFDGAKLELQRCIPCLGNSPRDFDFINGYMICTNEGSDSVTVFDAEHGFEHIQTVSVEKPLNVIEA